MIRLPRKAIAAFTGAAVVGLSLAGCTASRYQISDALMRYGLDSGEARCAAEFLRGKLSVSQVDRLSDAARFYRGGDQLTFGDLVAVAASVRDPQVALQTAGAAAACGIAGDIPIPGL